MLLDSNIGLEGLENSVQPESVHFSR